MKYKLGIILIPFLLLSACKEDPAPTGTTLLPDSDLVDVVQFDTRQDAPNVVTSTYFRANKGETSALLWLGETGEYRSEIMLRWYNFSEPIGDEGTILETKMVLHKAADEVGTSSGTISFDVLEISDEVSIADVTSESMGSIPTFAQPRGTYTGSDTTITVQLDTAMVREWMRRFTKNVDADTSTAGPEPYGIKIVPKGMSHIQSIVSGNSTINYPELIMIVDRDGDIDTLRGTYMRDTYAAWGPDLSAQPLTVHGGLSYRSRMMFDVSAIPPGSIVNYVRLTVTRNPAAETRSLYGTDSVLVYEALSTTIDSAGSSSTICQPTSGDESKFVAEGTINTATLILAVQRWINSPDLNNGLIVTKINERYELDQLTFYGGDAEPDLQPRLEIYYTTKP